MTSHEQGTAIHRKTISLVDEHVFVLPQGSAVLHIAPAYLPGVHGAPDRPVIEVWYLGDGNRPDERRSLRVLCTGAPALDVDFIRYWGTVVFPLDEGGREVWHVFDGGLARDLISP